MFEKELFAAANKYPDKQFLVCCFESVRAKFRGSEAPVGNPHLSVRHGRQGNVHFVYLNGKFSISNRTLETYFGHQPELVSSALTSPRFVWADFCGDPSAENLHTITQQLRHGDMIYSTFNLQWRQRKLGSVTPSLALMADYQSSQQRGQVVTQKVRQLAYSAASYRGCGAYTLDHWVYKGNVVPMVTSGFEVCSRG